MKYTYTAKKRIRKNFGKLNDALQMPNLIELQLESYNNFLGLDAKGNIEKSKSGLHSVFESFLSVFLSPF